MPQLQVENSERALDFHDHSPMQEVAKEINVFAPSNRNVLITGGNGTGKETIAKLIHQNSKRKDNTFKVINCAGIPETLLESILFGHEKGSFTGADKQRIGAFEAANGGTLFLDEVGEMSPQMQTKLLRVLQEKKVMRVGGNEEIPVTARIIAATNIDIPWALERNKINPAEGLRSDLYYRLAQVEMHVPDLRERKMDIPVLVEHFAKKEAASCGCAGGGCDCPKPPKFDTDSMQLLTEHDWPGNIRELENVVARAVVRAEYAKQDTVTPHMLRWSHTKNAVATRKPGLIEIAPLTPKDDAVAFSAVDKVDVGALLSKFNGQTLNMNQLATATGINNHTLKRFVSDDPSIGTVEKLGHYLMKTRGEGEAIRFFRALMKRVDDLEKSGKDADIGASLPA